MPDPSPIHEASPENPILLRYEPGFRRVYAKGALVRKDAEDPETLRLSLWSDKEEVPLDGGKTGIGYMLEVEAAMTWRAAERLKVLLEKWLKEYEDSKRRPTSDPKARSTPPGA
jgi:hypothetical protein